MDAAGASRAVTAAPRARPETCRFVCVTGMHRSGTSAVARLISMLGVHLGDETGLIGSLPDNPEGFWERIDIVSLNESRLHALGGSWDDPPLPPERWDDWPRVASWQAMAEAAAGPLGGRGTLAGWKDPRTSLLLPFWATVVPLAPTILVVRQPAAVATSLAARNRLGPERSAYLWLRYTAAAWRDDPDRVVLHYEDLVDDPPAAAARL